MTHCAPGARRRVRDAASAARALDIVVAADVLDPDTDPSGRWTLWLLVETDRERGLPWQLHHLLGTHRLSSIRHGPQGPDLYEVVAVA